MIPVVLHMVILLHKMLSIKEAEVEVILVGLVIRGTKPVDMMPFKKLYTD